MEMNEEPMSPGTEPADFAPTAAEEVSPDVEAVRADIEATRAQMTETVDAIKEKLSPAHLVQEAKESIKEATVGKAEQLAETVVEKAKGAAASASDALHSAADFVSEKAGPAMETVKARIAPAVDTARDVATNVGATAKGAGETIVDTIRMNPLPAAVIGFGIGWLVFSMRRHNESAAPGEGIYESEAQYGDGAFDESMPENGAGSTIKEAWSNAGNAVNNFATGAKTKASDIAVATKEKASDLAMATKEKAQAGASAVDTWGHENPLGAGAVALLVGAAVGLALPATAKENTLFGPKRDELAHKAAETAQDVVGKVQTVAEKTFGTAKTALGDATEQIKTEVRNEAQNQGLSVG